MSTGNRDSSTKPHAEAPDLSQSNLSRVHKLLAAIERVCGVKTSFLDATSRPAALGPDGSLVVLENCCAALSATILQLVGSHPRPVLHSAREGGAAVALPFLIRGRLAGFIEASRFCLPEPDEGRRAEIKKRFIVDNLQQAFVESESCREADFDTFFAMVELLEAATAELTFLAAMAQKGQARDEDEEPRPLPWTVWSFLHEVGADVGEDTALSEAVLARERLEALYDSTQYGTLMLDKELKIVAANKVFGEVFGAEPAAFIGVSGDWLRRWVVKHAADPERVSTFIDELFSTPDAVMDDEIELVSPTHRILRFFSSPTKNKAGEIVGRVFMFRDITEFRQARHDMIGNEKMSAIGRVAAGLAHGLNNILAGVVTYADYALEEGGFEKIKGALRMSIAAAEKASQLVGKLLVVAGSSESQRQDVDLHVELERLLDALEEDFKKDEVRIHRLLEPVPQINVDPVQMQEAFRHVLENACQAIGQGGTITVKTETDWDAGNVLITISDSGPGIPTELSDRVFDPFFTTRGVVSGGAETSAAGLGLSITKGIIEQHGGKIYAAKVLPHGAAFVIELPLAGAAGQRPPPASLY